MDKDRNTVTKLITIWKIDLTDSSPCSDVLRQYLTNEEKREAAAQVRDMDRHGFVASKAVLRLILGKYLGVEPKKIRLRRNRNGKPELSYEYGKALHFNLSHAGGRAVIALTGGGPIGIDIEKVRYSIKIDDVSSYAFSPEEQLMLEQLSGDEKVHFFFAMWTRKEALIKAAGASVASQIDKTVIDHRNINSTWQPVGLKDNPQEWYLKDLSLFDSFHCAVCTALPGLPLNILTFDTARLD